MKFFSQPGAFKPAGLYGVEHLIAVIIIIASVWIALLFSRKVDYQKSKIILKVLFFVILAFEIAKIIYTIFYGSKRVEDIISLSFCALFLYSLALAAFGSNAAEKMGFTYIFYGGMVAGIIYMSSPVASLGFYPLWHFRTIQSMVYHGVMIYVGLLITIKGFLKPDIKDFKPYFLFTIFFSILAVLSNLIFHTNYMYLNDRLTISIMSFFNFLPDVIYVPFVILGQICGCFFLTYWTYKIIEKIKNKGEEKKND